MTENLIGAQYDVTKKSKLKKFYEKNKILIFSFIFLFIFTLGFFSFYLDNKEKQKILLSESYIQAKIYLEGEEKNKAKLAEQYNTASINYILDQKSNTASEMIKIIKAKDKTYSPLALYFLLDNNIVNSEQKINSFFDILINDTGLDKEIKNLIIYKKALYNSDFGTENDILSILKPLINSESIWKSHALYLLAEYFFSKNEKQKSKEFFEKILILENSNSNIKLEVQKRIRRDFSE